MTSFPPPRPYADDVEIIPADEADDILRVFQALETILKRTQARTGQFRADVHVKAHGYARGEFRVLPNLPDELAQGLFHEERIYPTVVRFSNGASQPQSDALPDARGLAIKVLEVAGDMVLTDELRGPTQDFIMINHPVFFARNVKDYLRLEQILALPNDSPLATLQGVLTGGDWNPLHWHWREMLTAAQTVGHFPSHLANTTFFSMTPIRYGKFIAKYRVKPTEMHDDSLLKQMQQLGTEADALRVGLEERLRTQDVRFEFQVQLRTSITTMPIEDASIEWPESQSPFRTVAHLVLPRQEIESLRHQPEFQKLSFNVWHALAVHRPLGGINRVRRWAYALSAAWRHQAMESASSAAPQ